MAKKSIDAGKMLPGKKQVVKTDNKATDTAVAQVQSNGKPEPVKLHRLTMDLPENLMMDVKMHLLRKKMYIRDYVIGLMEKDLKSAQS